MHLRGPTASGFVYSDSGGSGASVVFLHGVLMNGTLWKDVVDRLSDRYRCIVPEPPLGVHHGPMPDDAELVRVDDSSTLIPWFFAQADTPISRELRLESRSYLGLWAARSAADYAHSP